MTRSDPAEPKANPGEGGDTTALADGLLMLPAKLPATWVVDCKSVGDGSKALLYLGRYLYRGVIQERDFLRCDDNGIVTRTRTRWAAGSASRAGRVRSSCTHRGGVNTSWRVALVIGKAAYGSAPLANPVNDAKAMSETLKRMGFDVIEARDASKAQIQRAPAQAGAALNAKNGVGVAVLRRSRPPT